MGLAMQPSRPRIGLLDLDIFGPSIPRIMGLNDAPEPELNRCEVPALAPFRSEPHLQDSF